MQFTLPMNNSSLDMTTSLVANDFLQDNENNEMIAVGADFVLAKPFTIEKFNQAMLKYNETFLESEG